LSLVIAVKDKDRFVFGSDKQASTGLNKSHDATKIWEVDDLPGAIMAGVGSCRASQIIQYSALVDYNFVMDMGGVTTNYIINSMVPIIVGQLKNNGICCNIASDEKETSVDTMIPNTFLFAYQDKAWMIYHDLSVVEIENYQAIGSGAEVANGVLFATPEKNPFERIVTCIDAAAETTLFVDHGVDFLATEYYPKDADQMMKALGIEPEKKKEKPVNKKAKKTTDGPVENKKPVKKTEKKPSKKTK